VRAAWVGSPFVTTPIRRSPIHHGEVVAAGDLTPRMRRITVRSEAMLGVELRPEQEVEM
jgi:NADPH-dependent ferric siderophore reductase